MRDLGEQLATAREAARAHDTQASSDARHAARTTQLSRVMQRRSSEALRMQLLKRALARWRLRAACEAAVGHRDTRVGEERARVDHTTRMAK